MEYCDSYDGEVKDIFVDESGGDNSTSEIEVTGSSSDSFVDIRTLQWVEVNNSDWPHSIKNLSRARDNSE